MAEKDVYIQKGEILRGKKARKEMLKKDIEELKKRYPVIDVPKLKDSDSRQNISPISDGRTIGDNVDLDDKNSVQVHSSVESGIEYFSDESDTEYSSDESDSCSDQEHRELIQQDDFSQVHHSDDEADPRPELEMSGDNTGDDIISDAKVKVTTEASGRGTNIQTGTLQAKGVESAAEASAKVNTTGADVEVGNLTARGFKGSVKASATASATGATIKGGSAEMTGADCKATASASASASGANISVSKLEVCGAQQQLSATVSAKVTGAEINCGVASAMAVQTGATASATAEVKGSELQVGTVQIKGADLAHSAGVRVSTGSTLKACNVNVRGVEGAGVEAKVEAVLGLETLNVNAGGFSGKTGVSVSTKVQVGNINFTPGGPGLNIAPRFACFGVGGGGGVGGGSSAVVVSGGGSGGGGGGDNRGGGPGGGEGGSRGGGPGGGGGGGGSGNGNAAGGKNSGDGSGIGQDSTIDESDSGEDCDGESYGVLLSEALHPSIHRLHIDIDSSGNVPKKRRKIPEKRDEAIEFWEEKLSDVQKKHDKIVAESMDITISWGEGNQSGGSGAGVLGEGASNNMKPGQGEGNESSSTRGGDTSNSQPREKPFGASKNIHTLGCYQSSSKRIVNNGNFTTFSDS